MPAKLTLTTEAPFDWRQHFVLFGAGNLGRRVAAHLRALGNPALAFCDSNREIWGSEVEGLRVYAPAEAVAAFSDALFVVTIWHPSKSDNLRRRATHLSALGATRVTSFISFFLEFPDVFLPNMFWVSKEQLESEWSAIEAARELFDERGKQEFDRQLRFRLGDVNALNDPEEGLQYFPEDFVELSADECFVDCGAFDGDTLQEFLRVSGGRFRRYIALEPEPENRKRIEKIAAQPELQDKISIYPFAVGSERANLRFKVDGTSSAISEDGELSIECIPLDEILYSERPTFIKMDIEGFELDAIAGASESIRLFRPKVAICIYHRPDHLWSIPLKLHKSYPYYVFTMRMYRADGYESVCYGKPRAG